MRETARERRELARDAGFGGFSLTSVLAGVLVAYGAFAILLGLAAAVAGAISDDTDLSTGWEELGTGAGLVVAGLLLLSYLFGGYVAGRMARRNGLAHGAGVLVLGVLIVGGVAALARSSGGADNVAENLRSLGIPTTADEYGDAGTVAGIASLLALVLGSLLGGVLGERWHARLFARAVDPTVGAQADAARQAEEARTQANLALARSEGRVRAHELERDRDRDRTVQQEQVLDDERDRRIDLEQERERDLTGPNTANTAVNPRTTNGTGTTIEQRARRFRRREP
ncbi:MAG TPA: YrzE family protein [Acidimicrobiales bacterium]|nr:YrzE family protein [Acidimicrobiales bacterium]